MKFCVNREALLEPLQLVSGVVERRQTLAVLSNLLCIVTEDGLRLTGTDQEVELSASINLSSDVEVGETTIPAKKFVDICRSLPAKADISIAEEGNRIVIQSGRFKSHLATLPAQDFPLVEMEKTSVKIEVSGSQLNDLLDKTSFAMAQQDVRYFFNGMLLEVEGNLLRTVATNGQRLATSHVVHTSGYEGSSQFIVPRKGVTELARLIKGARDEKIVLQLSANHLCVVREGSMLATKLVDGVYPDYDRAIPSSGDKVVQVDRLELKEALSRIAILSNEMYRNVKLLLTTGKLQLHANNPMQEEAEESVSVDYEGESLEIGFNVGYLIDVLATLRGEKVMMILSDTKSAVLMRDPEDELSRFVVSPMML